MDDNMINLPARRSDLIQNIEYKTSRAVRIEAVETDRAFAKCNAQAESPLFALLPREIRDLVWEFATAPYEDVRYEYGRNEYYYRPGHTARLRTDTALLLTCRRIWLEANAFPMLQAEHCFWYYRAAPDGRNSEWMERLSSDNRKNFGELHLFAQMFAIERLTSEVGMVRKFFLQSGPKQGDFQPRVLHVTIRHTDFWFWENEAPLRLKDSWVQALLDSPDTRSTQTLKLELETLDYKVDQLLPIVERLEGLESKEFKTHVIDGIATSTKFVLRSRREVQKWSGPANINGQTFRPYKHVNTLNYHVITLTWKLVFPQMPQSHVPNMRRAPRIPQTAPVEASREEDCDTDYTLRYNPDGNSFGRPIGRGYKKLRAGLQPTRKQPSRKRPYLEMPDEALRVRMESVQQARTLGHARQEWFTKAMNAMYVAEWEEKWERDQCLLRFE